MCQRETDTYTEKEQMTSFTQLWKLASLKFVKLAGKLEIQGRADNTAWIQNSKAG